MALPSQQQESRQELPTHAFPPAGCAVCRPRLPHPATSSSSRRRRPWRGLRGAPCPRASSLRAPAPACRLPPSPLPPGRGGWLHSRGGHCMRRAQSISSHEKVRTPSGLPGPCRKDRRRLADVRTGHRSAAGAVAPCHPPAGRYLHCRWYPASLRRACEPMLCSLGVDRVPLILCSRAGSP